MLLPNLFAAATLLASGVSSLPAETSSYSYGGGGTGTQVLALQAKGLVNLAAYTAKHGLPNPKCTLRNVAVRKEW